MKAHPQKWGNSWAVRIPKVFAQRMNFGPETSLDIEMEGEALMLRPKPKRLTLEQIVASLDASDPHTETDWGGEIGCETID